MRLSTPQLLAALLATAGCIDRESPPIAPPPPRALVIAPRNFTIVLGGAFPLTVSARDATGAPASLAERVTFTSRAPDIVAVDSTTGLLTARARGAAWIVATTPGNRVAADSVVGTVGCTSDLRAEVTPAVRTLRVGETFTPAVRVSTCLGQVALDDTASWRSLDPRIATVDAASGLVTAVAPGATDVVGTGRRYQVWAAVRVTIVAP